MTKLVTIGGGSGHSTLLKYLKAFDFDLTAIVSMVDDGGSSGKLRAQLGVLPPGDLRQCLRALATDQELAHQVLEYRFTQGDLSGHPVGNVLLSALELETGSITQAINTVAEMLHCKGTVIPVSTTSSTLFAALEDDTIIEGETNIDVPQHDTKLQIKRVYLQPEISATPDAVVAIENADWIIFSIGDLFTSVIPNILVTGIADALQRTSAKLVYTCNRSHKPGETDGFMAHDYVARLQQYIGRKIDYLIMDTTPGNSDTILCDTDQLEEAGVALIQADLHNAQERIDGEKLAKVIHDMV